MRKQEIAEEAAVVSNMLSDGLKGGIAEQALSVALANFPEVRSLDCKAVLAACVKATL